MFNETYFFLNKTIITDFIFKKSSDFVVCLERQIPKYVTMIGQSTLYKYFKITSVYNVGRFPLLLNFKLIIYEYINL